MCQTPNSARMAALPIVSQSPGPVSGSCSHLPRDQGEPTPDKQKNSTGGGGQTPRWHYPSSRQSHSCPSVGGGGGQPDYDTILLASVGVWGSFLPAQSLEPPGPNETLLSWERSGGSNTTSHRHVPSGHSQAVVPSPYPTRHTRVWVGGADHNAGLGEGKRVCFHDCVESSCP